MDTPLSVFDIFDLSISVFFSFFQIKAVPWVLSLFLLVLALVFYVYFRFATKPILKDIEKAFTSLKATPEKPEEFVRHYEELNESLLSLPTLYNVWREFSEGLILPFANDNSPLIRNTERPDSYFNIRNCLAPKVNLRQFQSFPNTLIGLGLLFTFLGLVAALYFASKGFAAEATVEQVQENLGNLLSAATFKFLTSVAGLLASLAFGWAERRHLHAIEDQLYAFSVALDHRMRYATAAHVSNMQLKEAGKQTHQLERFNQDLALNIAQAMEKPFERALGPLLEELSTLKDRVGSVSEEGMRQLVEDFRSSISGGASQELKGLIESVSEISRSLDTSGGSLKEALVEGAGEFKGAAEQSANLLKEGFANITDNFKEIESSLHVFNDSVAQLSNANNKLNVATTKLDHSVDGMSGASRQIVEGIAALSTEITKLNELRQNQETAAEKIKAATETLSSAWASYEKRFSGLDKDLGSFFQDVRDNLERLSDSVGRSFGEWDQASAATISRFVGAVENLNEQSTELAETMSDRVAKAIAGEFRAVKTSDTVPLGSNNSGL